jgi:hypothetical protein
MRRALATLPFVALAACGESTTWPGNDSGRRLSWQAECRAQGADVACVLRDTTMRDQTANAVWTVEGPAIVAAPGQVRTTGRGEIVVRGGYVDYRDGPWQVRPVGRFLVDPQRTARPFLHLGGRILDTATSQPVGGAQVTILDGYDGGRSDTTQTNGHYLIEPVVTGEDFTVRVEKAGYETLATRYRVDDRAPVIDAPGNPPRLDLRLTRLPGA